jgi:hypothetical protein
VKPVLSSAVAGLAFHGLLENRLEVVVLRLTHREHDKCGDDRTEDRRNPETDVHAIGEGTIHAPEFIEDDSRGCRFHRARGQRPCNGGNHPAGDDCGQDSGTDGPTNLGAGRLEPTGRPGEVHGGAADDEVCA